MTYRILLSFYVFIGVAASFSTAQAQSAKLDDLLKCQSIELDADRLACFDEKVGAFSDAANKGEIVAVEKETIKDIERDSFGFNLPSIPRLSRLFGVKGEGGKAENDNNNDKSAAVETNPSIGDNSAVDRPEIQARQADEKDIRPETGETKTVSLTIERVRKHNSGKLKFLFSNGQIWEQTDARALPKIRLREGRVVTAEITKGAWGSFFLRVNGKGEAIKVRRTR